MIEQTNLQVIELTITACPKPRMTQSDRWRSRPPVVRYRRFADKLRLLWGDRVVDDRLDLTFILPMPRSWSKAKKAAMDGKPHQQKPDTSNLLKAFEDALVPNIPKPFGMLGQRSCGVQRVKSSSRK